MKENKKIARNYAQALLEVAKGDLNKQDLFQKEVKEINELILKNEEIKKFITNPVISKDEKKKFVETLRQSVSFEIMNFLYLLIDKQRFNILSAIQDELTKLVNKAKGIVIAEVSGVSEIDSNTLEKLREKLENILGKGEKILIKSKIEPDLIGGLKVRINDLVFDGSIKGRLENIKRRLG